MNEPRYAWFEELTDDHLHAHLVDSPAEALAQIREDRAVNAEVGVTVSYRLYALTEIPLTEETL